MTHIDNVAHILTHGITHKDSPNASRAFTPIGDTSLISARSKFELFNGRSIGKYIPFYFGARTPMLYVIQKGFNGVISTPAQEIVYCVSSVQQVLNTGLDFVFTDGHAVDSFTSQYTPADINSIESLIDLEAVNVMDWKSETDLDLKRRKQAEFLVLGDMPYSSILGFVVYNQFAKNRLLQDGATSQQVLIRQNLYF